MQKLTDSTSKSKRIYGSNTRHRWPTRPPLDRSNLDEAKRRLTISAAWHALGLPGEPRRLCCSPFRQETRPSFSITGDALWHDLGTGEGGDVVGFVRRATGCSDREAIETVLDLAGLGTGKHAAPLTLTPRQVSAKPEAIKRDELTGLDLQPPTVGELARIAELRAWPLFAGLEIASRRGLLRCSDVRHHGEKVRAWILTDDDRRAGMARRMDGEPWEFNGHTSKTNALRSDDEHPPGLADVVAHDRPGVLLCEGEPDALAAHLVAWLADVIERVGVVCLPGAARQLPPSVLEKLKGRRVRIVRQNDAPARKACLVWLSSLAGAGIAADLLPLDDLHDEQGRPAKDLADLIRRPADHETLDALALHVCAPFIK